MFSSSPSLPRFGSLKEMPPHHVQGLLGGLHLNLFSLSRKQVFLDLNRPRPGQSNIDQPDRLLRGSARRSGDASDSQAEVGPRASPDARGHGPDDRNADRAVGLEKVRRHSQKIGLGDVAVNDDSLQKIFGTPRYVGQAVADQSPGARFGNRQR